MDTNVSIVVIKDHIYQTVVGRNFHILNRKELGVQVEEGERNPKTKGEIRVHSQKRRTKPDKSQTVTEVLTLNVTAILNQQPKVQNLLLKEFREQRTNLQEQEEQKL